MPEFFLLISDSALREAVIEQIAAAKIGDPRLADSAAALVKQGAGEKDCVIVIDEAAYDKKTAVLLRDMAIKQANTVFLMLGGADDAEGLTETFPKPFRLGHFVTRLRYYLETAPLLRDRIIAFGPWRLEAQNRRILCANKSEPIKLTEKETAVLVFLADQTEPVTRQDILAAVWGYDERIDTHTLETHIYQLRRKLDKESENWLIFETGAYRLARDET